MSKISRDDKDDKSVIFVVLYIVAKSVSADDGWWFLNKLFDNGFKFT